MNWITCDSSNIHSYAWVAGHAYPLQIRFHRKTGTPSVYGYKAPHEEFDQLHAAESKGSYFAAHIKELYDFIKLSA